MREVVPPAPKAPPLVWSNGQLMRTEMLAREVAAPRMMSVRSIVSGHPAKGLTPARLASLLLQAEQGDMIAYLELAEEMEEKDPHYLSVLGTRKRAVARMPIEVEEADDSEEAKADAQLVRDWLDRDMLQAEIFDIMDAVGKGFSVTEMIWDLQPGLWQPEDLKWRDPRWFEFDRVNGETLRLRTAGEPEALPAGKFIVHFHKAKSGLPIRGGLARVVAWGWMFKNFSIKDWVSFLETYGMPLRVGRYDNGETEDNIEILARAVADLGADAAAVFPKTMEVEFIDGKGGSAPSDLWRSMAEYIDDQVSKVVLGQTNTTDAKAGGLGSGQAEVHDGVREDIADADAVMVAATLNRDFVKPLIIFNRGPRRKYPRLKIGKPDEVDVKAMTEAAAALVPLGVKVGADQMRERAGLPAPEAGEDVLTAAGSPTPENLPAGAPPGTAQAQPQRSGTRLGLLDPLKRPDGQIGTASAPPNDPSSRDAIDEAADSFLDDWTALVDPVLSPVEQLIASASSLEQVREGLTGLIERMDAGELTGMLALAGFASRLAGDAAQQGDEREAS